MFACLYVPPRSAMRSAPAPDGDAPDATRGFITRSRGAVEPLYAGDEPVASVLLDIARMVSPRVAARSSRQVLVDVEGLERLVGDPRVIGERLRQAATDRGIAPAHVAVAGTCTAAMLLAAARAGVTVVAAGEEAAVLAGLPLRTLTVLAQEESEESGVSSQYSVASRKADARSKKQEGERREARGGRGLAPSAKPLAPSLGALAVLARWGLRTLGELAALPSAGLSERLGQDGIRWQRLARGEDTGPLAPAPADEPFESSLELEWPIADLEPLSFVLTRLLDPLCQRLERRDRGAAVLHLRLRLVTRDLHLRSLQLPAPMRDPKVLRTLLLLDLESHPAPAGVDAVTLSIDPTPGRIVQESLLARALPAPELISTLVARLQALMGEGRCGSPATVDSYRPGVFAMAPFVVEQKPEARSQKQEEVASSQYSVASRRIPNPESRIPAFEPRELAPGAKPALSEPRQRRAEGPLAPGLRRFRLPIPARVLMDGDRPVSVRTDRPTLAGGRVHASAGPWRTSGEWWKTAAAAGAAAGSAAPSSQLRRPGWNRDEWDVALGDGGLYRIFEDRDTGRWFVGAVVD